MTKSLPLELNWSLKPEEIQKRAEDIIQRSKTLQDQIAALPGNQQTFESVILPLAHSEGWEQTQSASCYFPQYVHPDKSIRDASMTANKALEEYDIECSMRTDVYKVVKNVYDQTDRSKLDEEDARFFTKLELQYRRDGLALNDEQREQLKTLKKRLSDLSIDFQKHINEDKTQLEFTREELAGLSEDFISGLKRSSTDPEKYIVTMKYPDLFPMLDQAEHENVRQRMDVANGTRCKENVALLEEAIRIREQMAKILGYPNHAAFTLEVRMAKETDKVKTFLQDLAKRLKPLAEKEITVLRALKEKDKKERGETFDGKLNSWDFRYYHRKLLKAEYQVNDEEIKPYFSLSTVTKGMLELYQQVLDLKFEEVQQPPVWHSDVQLFEVKDRGSGELVGYFFLDLFPREGKYTHAACFGLQPGSTLSNGQRQYPAAAMVANFTKPTSDKPSLLKHDEVVTYYHELGHVMHQLCSKTRWTRFHGTKVERDFVEAPSQMLENWCWESSVLRNLSAHYSRKDADGQPEKIPLELCDKVVAAKNVNAGLLNLRQIFFATFDLTLHSMPVEKDLNTTELYAKLRKELALIPGPEGSFPAATFGHIMGGYDAGYYGYLWSQVFSADMYHSRFKKEGIDNVKTGLDYRRHILQPGGSRDGSDMLKNFLGRDPNADAFLRSIGLNAK